MAEESLIDRSERPVPLHQRDGFEDPMRFVKDHCRRHSLPFEAGTSQVEKECARRADLAREDYKARQMEIEKQIISRSESVASLGSADCNERKKLTPSQKYGIRLRNNRKSANASKVYGEVLKREISHRLRDVSTPDCRNCELRVMTGRSVCEDLVGSERRLEHLMQQIRQELYHTKREKILTKSYADQLYYGIQNINAELMRSRFEGHESQPIEAQPAEVEQSYLTPKKTDPQSEENEEGNPLPYEENIVRVQVNRQEQCLIGISGHTVAVGRERWKRHGNYDRVDGNCSWRTENGAVPMKLDSMEMPGVASPNASANGGTVQRGLNMVHVEISEMEDQGSASLDGSPPVMSRSLNTNESHFVKVNEDIHLTSLGDSDAEHMENGAYLQPQPESKMDRP